MADQSHSVYDQTGQLRYAGPSRAPSGSAPSGSGPSFLEGSSAGIGSRLQAAQQQLDKNRQMMREMIALRVPESDPRLVQLAKESKELTWSIADMQAKAEAAVAASKAFGSGSYVNPMASMSLPQKVAPDASKFPYYPATGPESKAL